MEYFHIMFDHHEIIYAEGIPSESFYAWGSEAQKALPSAQLAELQAIFPELANKSAAKSAARYVLKLREGKLLAEIMHS